MAAGTERRCPRRRGDAFDPVAGEVGFGVRLPREIDGEAVDYGFKADGGGWRGQVVNCEGEWG